MKVLVTGGAGFIGSHLAEKLLERGDSVTIYDNFMRNEESEKNVKEVKQHPKSEKLEVIKADILEFEKLKEAVKDKDCVYHLAALPSHRLAMKEPRNYARVDVIGTVNVLEAARQTEPQPTVLFASSNKVYGKRKEPFKETDLPKPEGPYGLSKYCSEEFCRMYAKYYGLNTPVIRYHHVIGPRCQPDRELSIFTERVMNGLKPIVHGHFEGGEFKSCAADYTNVYDAVEATVLAAKVKGFDVFNLATGKVTPVLKIAELVIKFLGKDMKPEFKELLPHESLLHWADVSKIKRVLGFEAKTPVETSVRQYIEWRLKSGPRPQAVYR
jgi:nucleoside-diphosphate-sugar epimerase